jgi:hypothetical protein
MFCSDFDEGSDEQLVRENCDIRVVVFSLIVVRSSRQCIGASVGFPFDVMDFDGEFL